VFHDIDLEKVSPEAGNRNKDPNAVFLVTGASRGSKSRTAYFPSARLLSSLTRTFSVTVGLQFVKALASKTQVRVVTHAISRRD
jgi:hypothetical protein